MQLWNHRRVHHDADDAQDSTADGVGQSSIPLPANASDRRAFDRFVNFTDAVVAIAITLMVLPLLDIAGPGPDETVWQILAKNAGPLFAFAIAFTIVARNWLVHNQIVNAMRAYDPAVFWLNIAWIASITLSPWVTAMYGSSDAFTEGGEGFGGTGMLFFTLLAVITGISVILGWYINRHRGLLDPDDTEVWIARHPAGQYRGVVLIIVVLVNGILTLFIPAFAAYLPIVLVPVGLAIAERLSRRRGSSRADDEPGLR